MIPIQLLAALAAATLLGIALIPGAPMAGADELPASDPQPLVALVAEARANNPEIAAARGELEAAEQRVPAAGALDDPMVELGVINAPLESLNLRREDMTMKMLGARAG